MEILIYDIPEEGLDISASQADAWFVDIVREVFGESYEKGDSARLALHIDRYEENINIGGTVEMGLHHTCDRCLEGFSESCTMPIHAVLAPLYENMRQRDRESGLEVELVREDLEFTFYEGDRFDLDEILQEQMLLAKPMKYLCRQDCKGLCQRCGADLNKVGGCTCREETVDPRWEALKGVQIEAPAGGPSSDKKRRRD